MDLLFKVAVKELGQKEIAGPENNPTIVNYAKESDFGWVDDDETPWCSIFLNWCAAKAGLQKSGEANARSWLMIGNRIENPEPGDIVILWRDSVNSWKGHVGIFFGFSGDSKRVYVLGGNQGNQVSISAYPSKKVLGYRRLRPSKEVVVPESTLKRYDAGDEVKLLQDALKLLGFDCGTSDGIFGSKTERALRALQSTKTNLNVDGVFGPLTREYIIEKLNL